jgi:hypothetical protein
MSAHGKALRDFLHEKYAAINDVTTCTSWEHTVGKQLALGVLKEIFSFLEEKKVHEKPPSQYT